LAQVANRLHVATIHSKDKSLLPGNDSDKPLALGRNGNGKSSREAGDFRQDAHESNDIWLWRRLSKGIFGLEPKQIAPVAKNHFRLEGKLLNQDGAKLSPGPGLTNDKRARRPDVHDVIVGERFGENARAECSMSSHIDAPEENDESHSEHFSTGSRRPSQTAEAKPRRRAARHPL
jgi:hypothetical protein